MADEITSFSVTIGEMGSWGAHMTEVEAHRKVHQEIMAHGAHPAILDEYGHAITSRALSMLWVGHIPYDIDYPDKVSVVKLVAVHSSSFKRAGFVGYDHLLDLVGKDLGLVPCSVEVPYVLRSQKSKVIEKLPYSYSKLGGVNEICFATQPAIDAGNSPNSFSFQRVVIGRDKDFWLHADVSRWAGPEEPMWWIFEDPS